MFTITIMLTKRKLKAEKISQLIGELKSNKLAQVLWLWPSRYQYLWKYNTQALKLREPSCDLCLLHITLAFNLLKFWILKCANGIIQGDKSVLSVKLSKEVRHWCHGQGSVTFWLMHFHGFFTVFQIIRGYSVKLKIIQIHNILLMKHSDQLWINSIHLLKRVKLPNSLPNQK